jgi:hypothetical protein
MPSSRRWRRTTPCFQTVPHALLGVILMFDGLELAAGMHVNHFDKEDRHVMLLTVGVSM